MSDQQRLQWFLPMSYITDNRESLRTIQGVEEIARVFPAFYEDDSIATLESILQRESARAGSQLGVRSTHIDSFGATLIEMILQRPVPASFSPVLIAPTYIPLIGQLIAVSEADRALIYRKLKSAAIERVSADATKKIGTIAARYSKAFEFVIEQFVANTMQHASSGRSVSWRYRLSVRTNKLQFDHSIAEIAFATPSKTISAAVEETVPDDLRLTEEEALFFALLPGFSSSSFGISKPEGKYDRGTALFFLSQIARFGGNMIAMSGTRYLMLGELRQGYKQWKSGITSSEIELSSLRDDARTSFSRRLGTVFALQLDAIRFSFFEVVREVSQFCALRFWERAFPDKKRLLLTEVIDRYGSLKAAYKVYLESESQSLTNEWLRSTVFEALRGEYPDDPDWDRLLPSRISDVVKELSSTNSSFLGSRLFE